MPEQPPEAADLVAVGQIVGTHGIRGDVKVSLLTDYPDRLLKGRTYILESPEGERREVRSQSGRFYKHGVLLKLRGVDNPEEAAKLRGSYLLIPKDERQALPEDTFYIDDLVGVRVVTEEGQELGTIRRVIQGAANDVYETEVVLIPALKEVVREVDLAAKRMVIRPPAGLLDPEVA